MLAANQCTAARLTLTRAVTVNLFSDCCRIQPWTELAGRRAGSTDPLAVAIDSFHEAIFQLSERAACERECAPRASPHHSGSEGPRSLEVAPPLPLNPPQQASSHPPPPPEPRPLYATDLPTREAPVCCTAERSAGPPLLEPLVLQGRRSDKDGADITGPLHRG